ncbi:NPCBM/NEW2 domain-containing protein [Hyaloraphidium curvatum]|nr:NPCBM/NEW2 domain-containing protein [Hyaloraphidium curvatum]
MDSHTRRSYPVPMDSPAAEGRSVAVRGPGAGPARARRTAAPPASPRQSRPAAAPADSRDMPHAARMAGGPRRTLSRAAPVSTARVAGAALLALLAIAAAPAAAAPLAQRAASFLTFPRWGMAADANPAADPFANRSLLALVDLPAIAAYGPPELLLPLFGTPLVAVRDRVEEVAADRFTWFGAVKDDPLSAVVLSVTGGLVAGTVRTSHKVYAITPVSGRLHRVSELDESRVPEGMQPLVPPQKAPEERRRLAKRTAELVELAKRQGGDPIIDVMVLWTPGARAAQGGEAQIRAIAQTATDETNEAYRNSGIVQRIRLVHAEELDVQEQSFVQLLGAITQDTPGTVRALRDQYAADLVVLLTSLTTSCGVGWQMQEPSVDFADNGYSVVSHACAAGVYSFGHELGHNMGAHHDRANAGGPGVYPYSYGYQHPQKLFRTVMAYQCPDSQPGECPRVMYFSNPDVSYTANGLNERTGVDSGAANSADNARTLNMHPHVVAAFRNPATTTTTLTTTTTTYTATQTATTTQTRTQTRTATTTAAPPPPPPPADPCLITTRGTVPPLSGAFSELSQAPSSSPAWTCATAMGWPCARNGRIGAVRGRVRPMRVGGRRYARGFGVRGASTVAVRLDGMCGSLRVAYGLDAASAASARVVFSVWADGRRVFASTPRSRAMAAAAVDVNLVGVRRLELRTALTGAGLNYGQWIDPVLACGPKSPYLPTLSLSPPPASSEPGRTLSLSATARDVRGAALPATSITLSLFRVSCTAASCGAPVAVTSARNRNAASFRLPALPAGCGYYFVEARAVDSCGRTNVASSGIWVASREAACA